MRDEGPYLLEWVAYHRIIGFTDFLIYTNDYRDGTGLLLDRLQLNGIVTHVRNKVLKRGPHKSALKSALSHPLYEQAEWVYVTDADEYLNVQLGDGKLDSLLERFPDAGAIPVTWRMFSNNGHVRLGSGLLVEALADCEPAEAKAGDVGRFVKSLFRPNASVERMGLHGPVYNDQAGDDVNWGSSWHEQNPSGDPTRPKVDFGYNIAQVNHYAVRSVEAYLLKRDSGRANHVNETLGIDYWTRWCRGGARDVSIQRHVSALRSEINSLLEDPITKALQYGSMAFHEKHLTALLVNCAMKSWQSINPQ